MVLRLLQSDSGFVGVVVEVLVVAPEEAVLQAVVVRVLGSASLFQTDFVLGGTTRVYDLWRASFLAVLSAVPELRWFGFCFVSDRRTSLGYHGYLRFVPVAF